MTNSKLSTKNFILLILLAYIFSLSVRTIWVYQFNGVEEFRWNNQLMINTNDGYGYAEGARDILSGTHQKGDGSFIDTSLAIVTAFFVKVLPFSFETIILWMPTFLGSLLVIPIMLMARALNQEYAGFIGALLGGIAWSYYNRTMTGYYDTDMLTIVLPALTLWAVIFAMIKEKNRYILLVALFMVLSNWWYFQNYSLSLSMAGMVLVYTLIFDRKNLFNYKILIFMLIALSQIALLIKLPILLALFGFFHTKKNLEDKVIYSILALSILIILITGGFDPIISRVNGYLFRDSADTVGQTGLHYFSVVKTVREAGQIPFETFANRISGDTTIFILSIIGYLLLLFKNRIFLLSLPMVGLGFIALWGGLRFTVYAVPILALGMGYHIIYISNFIKEKKAKLAFVSIATIAILIPNILHIEGYKVPTVFNKQAVEVLDKLKNIASREDYVLAWWDYGYPIRYYSDVKTFIDGARHSGSGNYAVSFALLHNQQASANIARLDVEYKEKALYDNNFTGTVLEIGMREYNISNVNKFIHSLNTPITLPKKTRDIYFYLPFKMMNILPTVDLFANLNPLTGQEYKSPLFFRANLVNTKGNMFNLSNGMQIRGDKVIAGKNILPINQFVVTEYDNRGILHKRVRYLNIGSPFYVIYMKNYNQFLILDKRMFNSTYIKLFVLEDYDHKLFEPTILTPFTKVFKLKI
jgi:dolichyl-diphosphooligosaccharide--protein glycosyltransferase/undecaprenyl-diphosphooligosaccharide--protein glycosyltransferase